MLTQTRDLALRRFTHVRHRGLAAAAVALTAGAVPLGSAEAQGTISVAPNVMVSAARPGWEHMEYVADADPSDPNRVMVCSQRFSPAENRTAPAIYTTFDGGKHWGLSLDDQDSAARFYGVWDPACAYGLNGQAFFVTIPLSDTFSTRKADFNLHRSPDGGRSWEARRRLPAIDNEKLVIDRTNSPYRGRMYMYGNNDGPGTYLVYSTDSGRTWNRSERIENRWADKGTVLPNGALLFPVLMKPDSTMRMRDPGMDDPLGVAASTDGGVHIAPAVSVATVRGRSCRIKASIMASDHSAGSFRGRAYIVWADDEGEYSEQCAVFLAYSDDGGKRWSAPIRVSDGRPRTGSATATKRLLRQQLMPQVVVNTRGVVGVTWYDPGPDTTNRDIKLRFAASLDGGETWLPSVAASTHGFVVKAPPEWAVMTNVWGGGSRQSQRSERSDVVHVQAFKMSRTSTPDLIGPSDYTGIAAGADGAFHAFWIDNRSGVGEMYSARVSVSGTVARPEAALAPLADITAAIEVQVTASVWDPRARTISWAYQLLNTSSDTIFGPLKLRIAQLQPSDGQVGVPVLLLDGGRTGRAGTVLDLSPALGASGLRPGQTTPPQRLRVRLDDMPTVLNAMQQTYVEMTVKVYGTRRGAGAAAPVSHAP